MSLPRVRLEGSSREGPAWLLEREQARHLIAVRRCRDGDLFEGLLPGRKYLLRLHIDGSEARGLLISESPEELIPEVWLLAGLLKGEAFDRLISQSVEAGASVIVPLICSRSVVSIDPSRFGRKMVRWQRIILEASKQCGAATPTKILEPIEPAALGSLAIPPCRFVAVTGYADDILTFSPSGKAAIAVGPEGDWTEEERAVLREEGFVPVRLGSRIMRSQTAAVVAVACLSMITSEDRDE